MKRLASAVIPALLALILAGCGDHDHERVVVNLRVVEIFSDPTLDGDITADLAIGTVGVPTIAANTENVPAGINVSPVTGASISETRAFLVFPLGALPSNASIQFATITVPRPNSMT